MKNNSVKISLCILLSAVILALGFMAPMARSFAEVAGASSENYALASNGATYEIIELSGGEEIAPSFFEEYSDEDNTKLNDGVASVGENAESSVILAGTSKTYLIKFDLGQTRKINMIVIRNVISRKPSSPYFDQFFTGYSQIISIDVDGIGLDYSYTEKNYGLFPENIYGENGPVDIIMEFSEIETREVSIRMMSPRYLLMLDEIEIYYDSSATVTTTSTETTATETLPDNGTTTVNYALPSYGAAYTLSMIDTDGAVKAPEFYREYTDDDLVKLTDGASIKKDDTEYTVGFANRTGRIFLVNFDLGQIRKINSIKIKSFYIGTRGLDYNFELSADGVDIESETLCDQFGDTIFPDHTLVFDEISARQITIKISDKKSIISLDEVEIIGVEEKNWPDPAAEQITGDVNGDNEVDSSDATLILKYDAGSADLTDGQKKAADVNRDGEADSLDASYVLKYDAGIVTADDFVDMQIKRDFVDAQNEPGRAGDVEIKEKYGPYNGAYAMFINFNDWCFLTAITEETVADVLFRYPSSQTFTVYENGAFMTLEEANDSGVLSNDDVAALASEYYEKHPNFAQE